MSIDFVTFEEYKRLHGVMDQETFDKVVKSLEKWTQEQYKGQYRNASREIRSLDIGVPNPEDVIVYAAIKETINAAILSYPILTTFIKNSKLELDPSLIFIETYLVQGKSDGFVPDKYSFPATMPIRRMESSLIYGVPQDIMERLVRDISTTFKIPVIEFEDLMKVPKDILRDKLNEYRGKELIVKNAYDSTDGYTPDQTKLVYETMRKYTQDPYSKTQFYMFSDPTNPGLEQRAKDVNHPMFNWNTFVDLSKV